MHAPGLAGEPYVPDVTDLAMPEPLRADRRAGAAEVQWATGRSEAAVRKRFERLRATDVLRIAVEYAHEPPGQSVEALVWLTVAPWLRRGGGGGGGAGTGHRVGPAYLDFAERNPAVYDAMFQLDGGLAFAAEDTPEALKDGFAALWETLRDVPGAGVEAGLFTEVFRASLHGLATLTRAGRLPVGHTEARVELLVGRLAVVRP
ncbi:TetR-like C-terminal domain-containing protein [Streptomyces albogriseolus]